MPILIGGGSGSGGSGAGTELGYDQITAPVTVVSNTEATGTTIISCAAHSFDGNPVMLQLSAPYFSVAAGTTLTISLFEGATQIARLGIWISAAALSVPFQGWLRFTPTVGSHTYTITGFSTGAAGSFGAGAGGTGGYAPAFARFTKV